MSRPLTNLVVKNTIISMETVKDVSKWLDKKFLDWQYEQGGSRTLTEFAEWLGIPQSSLSNYMTGFRMPNEKAAYKLGAKLGWDVFDLLGLQRPDPLLQLITRLWDDIPEEQQRALAEEAERMAEENRRGGGNEVG